MATLPKFSRYANLTDEHRAEICTMFASYRELCCEDVGHAVACTSHSVLCKSSDRALNGKVGADAFAATLAVLVMAKRISLIWVDGEPSGKAAI